VAVVIRVGTLQGFLIQAAMRAGFRGSQVSFIRRDTRPIQASRAIILRTITAAVPTLQADRIIRAAHLIPAVRRIPAARAIPVGAATKQPNQTPPGFRVGPRMRRVDCLCRAPGYRRRHA